jgi:alkyl hydroperoxide reductase subunit AhpC
VCTTELGYLAKIKPEFDKRNAKILGLSIDPVDDHTRWAKDIEETQGTAPNYPIIGDQDLNVAKLYDMIHPNATGAQPRTAADNATIRSVFVVGPDKKVKLILTYPMTTGPQLRRGAARARLAAAHGQAQGGDACAMEGGRGRHHRRLGLQRRGEAEVSRRLEVAQALPADRAAAEIAQRRMGTRGSPS